MSDSEMQAFSGECCRYWIGDHTSTKLEVEPEDMTELQQSHGKLLTDEKLLPMDEQSKLVLWEGISWIHIEDCWSDKQKGF